MKRYFGVIVLLFIAGAVNAQGYLKGTVQETGSSDKLTNVFIKNLNNKQITLADKDGEFAIRASVGHVIVFDSPGYISDTLYVTDMEAKQVKMQVMPMALKQVNINASREAFDPHTEYPEVYTKSKVYILSPSSIFSRESKNARRLKRYFAHEEQERHVDEVFTTAYVGSIVPLKGLELQSFMALYRPSYDFIQSNTGPSLAVYINDSYKKYKELPAEKRTQYKLGQ